MIEVRNLSFAYGKEKVLDDISFKTEPGQLVAVLGPNGAGKSTLFKCLLGFMKSYEGQILIEGRDIKKIDRKQMARYIAYIPQSETPVFNYKVSESVLMGATGMLSPLSPPRQAQIDLANAAIKTLGIEYLAERGINEISGGERQLVFLARAIAQQARVLIMDEPTANLDYGNQQKVLDQVRDMASQGFTVLLSTHNPEHALQYATHVLAIKEKKVLASGTASETMDAELIEKIYGLKVTVLEVDIDGQKVRSCIPAVTRGGKI